MSPPSSRVEKAAPPTSAPAPKPPVVVREGAGQLFSFFDRLGEMRTVERRKQVSPEARGEVLVTVPGKHLGGDQVVVADLRDAMPSGSYRSWITTRAKWLDRTMPKKSLLRVAVAKVARRKVAKRRPKRQPKRVAAASPSTPPTAKASAPTAAAPTRKAPRILLFSTQWCPSCRRAKAYFQRKGVPFVELDVERDPRAAQAYQQVTRRYGLRGGSVPVIVIGDRVFQGFSPFQIEVALNQLMKKT